MRRPSTGGIGTWRSRATLLPVAALMGLVVGCLPMPSVPDGRTWPAHDGLRCVEVPTAQCEEMAAQAEIDGMPNAVPVRGVTVVCTRPEGCTTEVGAGEAYVHHVGGSESGFGWGYGSADGPPPAAPPGLGQPRADATIECIDVPQTVCDGRVDDVYLEIAPGEPQPSEIRVACAPGMVCTEERAEGTTEVGYADGRVTRTSWAMQGAEEPPGQP